MAEPFKEWFNPSVVAALGERQRQVDPSFPLTRFVAEATDGLAALELKGRVAHIAEALRRALPAEWPAAVDRLDANPTLVIHDTLKIEQANWSFDGASHTYLPPSTPKRRGIYASNLSTVCAPFAR